MVLIGSDWATTQAVQIWAVQTWQGSGRLDEGRCHARSRQGRVVCRSDDIQTFKPMRDDCVRRERLTLYNRFRDFLIWS